MTEPVHGTFWARPKRTRPRVAWLVALSFLPLVVPYPTRLSPPMSIQIVDGDGKGIFYLSGIRRGHYLADHVEERFFLDHDGRVDLPALTSWKSLASRMLSFAGMFLPHSGGFGSAFADLTITLPKGYELDPATASGRLTFTGRMGRTWSSASGDWSVSFVEYSSDANTSAYLSIATDRPTRAVPATYRFVCRKP
jgi:hypothetical protein